LFIGMINVLYNVIIQTDVITIQTVKNDQNWKHIQNMLETAHHIQKESNLFSNQFLHAQTYHLGSALHQDMMYFIEVFS